MKNNINKTNIDIQSQVLIENLIMQHPVLFKHYNLLHKGGNNFDVIFNKKSNLIDMTDYINEPIEHKNKTVGKLMETFYDKHIELEFKHFEIRHALLPEKIAFDGFKYQHAGLFTIQNETKTGDQVIGCGKITTYMNPFHEEITLKEFDENETGFIYAIREDTIESFLNKNHMEMKHVISELYVKKEYSLALESFIEDYYDKN